MIRLFKNCRILQEDEEVKEGKILVFNQVILGVYGSGDDLAKKPDEEIDLNGQIVFPGLINSHDHLYYSFWPKFGGEKAYKSWFEWEEEYRNSAANRKKQILSVNDLYLVGMYRNLFSGVSLIADHFPREVVGTFFDSPLVSFLEAFCLAHSTSSKSLNWGEGLLKEYEETKGLVPFVLHVKEGSAGDLTDEVETLERLGALGSNTILVNGVSLSDADLSLIAHRKASIVLCVGSNQFLFQQNPPIEKILDLGIRFAFGTDGVLTGGLNLFDELRTVKGYLDRNFPGKLSPREIVARVTRKAAEIFQIQNHFGSISPGRYANFLIFPDRKNDPFQSFFSLLPADISLVVQKGEPVYGDEKYRRFCAGSFSQYSEILVSGIPKIVWGKPVFLLERISDKLGETIRFPFLPIAEA